MVKMGAITLDLPVVCQVQHQYQESTKKKNHQVPQSKGKDEQNKRMSRMVMTKTMTTEYNNVVRPGKRTRKSTLVVMARVKILGGTLQLKHLLHHQQ